MRRFIQTHIEDSIAEKVIADYDRRITQVSIAVKDGELAINCL